MKFLLFTATAALALSACNRSDADRDASAEADNVALDGGANIAAVPPAEPGDAGVTTSPTAYLAQASASDLFEIESSRAVLNKSKNADVRQFAQKMIEAHQTSTQQVKQAAAADKLLVEAAALQPDQQTMLSDIKTADADNVDRVYLQHQRTAHTAALALHQGFARSSNTGKLVATAEQIAGVVQKHLAELDRVEASIIGRK